MKLTFPALRDGRVAVSPYFSPSRWSPHVSGVGEMSRYVSNLTPDAARLAPLARYYTSMQMFNYILYGRPCQERSRDSGKKGGNFPTPSLTVRENWKYREAGEKPQRRMTLAVRRTRATSRADQAKNVHSRRRRPPLARHGLMIRVRLPYIRSGARRPNMLRGDRCGRLTIGRGLCSAWTLNSSGHQASPAGRRCYQIRGRCPSPAFPL